MKRISFCLFFLGALCGSLPLQCDIDELVSVMSSELKERSFDVHRGVAKAQTNIIRYIVSDTGALIHVGVWSDCVIGTVMDNAPDVGTQVILHNSGALIDYSTLFSAKKKEFTHYYPWGKIVSSDTKQVIIRK